MLKRILLLCGCLMLVLGTSTAQLNLPLIRYVDNTVFAQNNNVWHTMVGAPALVSMAHGYAAAGYPIHYGVTSAGQVWEFVDQFAPANKSTWVQHPEFGTGIAGLAIGNGTIYALLPGHTCPAGFYAPFKWNGSALVSINGCVAQLSAAIDGTLAGSGEDSYIYTSTGAGVWTKITSAGSGWKYVSVMRSSVAIATKAANNEIYSVTLPAGTASDMSGTTYFPPAVDNKDNVYVIGTSTGSSAYKYGGSGLWTKFVGNGFSSISMCGSLCIYAQQSNGSTYQFPDMALALSQNMSGSVSCNGCSQETAYVRAHITGSTKHVGGAAAQASFAGGSSFNLTSTDTQWDPFDCYQAGGNDVCVANQDPAWVSNDNLHSDAYFAAASLRTISTEFAITNFLRLQNQPGINCVNNKVGQRICDYPVVHNCTVDTTPPDYDRPLVNDAIAAPAWDAVAYCGRWDTGIHSGPWLCANIAAIDVASLSPVSCTHNPQY